MVRLRRTDLLGLIGLVLLVAWTPTYYAQDPTEQALTGGTAFTLPAPHDGERIVLALHIQEGDGPVRVVRDAVTVQFDTHDPRTFPYGATMSLTVDHRPAEHNGTYVHYAHPGAAQTTWFDPAGRGVWFEEERTSDGFDTTRQFRNAHSGTPCFEPVPIRSGQHYRYVPSSLEVALRSFGDDEVPHPACPDHYISAEDTVNLAHRHGDDVLFAHYALRADRWYASATSSGEPVRTCPSYTEGAPSLGTSWNDYGTGEQAHDEFGTTVHLRLKPFTHACDVRLQTNAWNWISPDLPIHAGWRLQYVDAQGSNILRLDLLPQDHEPGISPLTIDPTQIRGETGTEPPLRNGPLESDESPLVHGRTLRMVHETALAQADDRSRAFIESADLVYFHWWAEERSVPAAPTVPPLGGQVERAPVDWDEWTLVYQAKDGRLRLYDLRIQTPVPVAPNTWSFVDRCLEQPDLWGCQKMPLDRAASIAPSALLDPPLPWLGEVVPELLDPSAGVASTFQFDPAGFLHHGPHGEWTLEPQNVDDWRTSTTWNLTSGALTSAREWSSPERPVSRATAAVSTEGAPRMVEHLATTLAWGGIVLLVSSAFLRLLGAIKTGAASAPLFGLYAKIRKDAVLDHERRDAMMVAIEEDPGLTPKELTQRLGIGWGNTLHHVETLRRNGLITQLAEGGRRHLFPAQIQGTAERRALACARNPTYAAFLQAVTERPGAPLKDLVPILPQGLTSASRTGSRLAALGLVEKRKSGRTVRFYPSATPGST